MNQTLLKNNYLIIPNFISSYRANNLKEEFLQYAKENNLEGDDQAPISHSNYNYISFLELLCEKTSEVSEILEETVLPTYTYSRIYKKNSVLEPHTDRDACEISLTLHLGSDSSWPIWIKTPEGEERSIELSPGDVMLYLGKVAEHWRTQYEGEEYVQVFLHYVKSRGECSYTYFDKSRNSENTKINEIKFDKIETTTYKKQINTNYSPIIMSSQTKLEEFIRVFDDVMSEDICDLILNEYMNSDEWNLTYISEGIVNNNVRSCTGIEISKPEIIQKNIEIRKNIDQLMHNSVSKIIQTYSQICPYFNVNIDTGYQLLKYETGQFYTQHTDSFIEQQRSLSCSIQLNEDYVGGEFAFFDRDMMIRSKKGSAIVFPSNFMYPHEIMPVIEGTRYSVITWLV